MQKTVSDLFHMIEDGTLKYETSTQRKFIYFTEKPIKTADGKITRAGNVIRSILQYDIQLPALYFWDNGDGTYNVHDGKQRLLSIYYFVHPTEDINVITRINGRQKSFSALTQEQQEKILNYTFDIVVKSGTSLEEENSFYLINTNGLPLSPYESLKGMFYGTWFDQFEEYVENESNQNAFIKKIGRGDQALLILFACFNLLGNDSAIEIMNTELRDVRNNEFHPETYKLDPIIELFTELKEITNIKDDVALRVASYIIQKDWDKNEIMSYYSEKMRDINDIQKWQFETHKIAIDKLIQDDIHCDGKRFFSQDDKDYAYRISQNCAHEGCDCTSYKDLQCDHITPWSKGGPTNRANLQLLCKWHNRSKSADEDGIKG